MATALTLVNRVRRELKIGETTTFTDLVSKRVLDAVNDSVATIFGNWDWDCDIRHDGIQQCCPEINYAATGGITNGSATVTLPTASPSPFATIETNRGVPRAVFTEDTAYGDTALRITTHASGISVVLDKSWPGTTDASATVQVVTNQFMLPVTVRKVLSVRHQETQVRLEEANRSQAFDRIIQRPHETVDDQPELVLIGGQDRHLYNSGTSYSAAQIAAQTWTSMTVYPTPSTAILLHYSYVIAHAEMTATTDTLDYVDRSLESIVVKLAFARCMQDTAVPVANFGGIANAGVALEQRALGEAQALHRNQSRDPGRHRVLGSNFSNSRAAVDFGRLPRNYGTGT